MKKSKNSLNNKGFMLLETLIVSTVILGTLVFLYVQFVNVKSSYEVSFKYNTVPGIFMANEIGNLIAESSAITKLPTVTNATNNYYYSLDDQAASSFFTSTVETNMYKKMKSTINADYVLIVSDNLANFKDHLSGGNGTVSEIFTPQFKKFILNLETDNTNKYRLIIQFSDPNNAQNNTFASVLIGGNA